ncbi:vanillate O-demethylase ferredoxin subunit [Actinoplanes lutulentus]|uniref:Ferredoxin-NADP reductase n=1 Tax=Actinoplanes lutulentus TaxID=1287878 RepID=A0A327Z1C1_9ACTN|nr:PDR/VanB family oxidoreductase [Actinoplanes lutulentus]MBB2946566.1 vanillate O-demethylase ferredoxin subunit [Actinoplanes lutulentus]RAK26484.1 ferredoxin-NADP reductase [Actinoplanes lutulentus]
MTPRRYDAVVVAHERVTEDVVLVRVQAPDLPAWQPGDHADLELAPGLVRQYSLCGTPGDDGVWTFAVLLRPDGAGGSRHVHDTLAVGAEVRVAGPKAMFALEDAEHHLLLAGGIGVTPILTMAEHLASQSKPFHLVYVGSTSSRMPFLDRVAALGDAVMIVDRSQTPDFTLAQALELAPASALVYACGPDRMISELSGLVTGGRLRTESFDPAGSPVETDGSFEVQFGLDGPVRQVPDGTPMLDVLLDAGADIIWSCREGTCGSCETPLLKGEADHRDDILTPDEKQAQTAVFPCVSRALCDRLVLDLPAPPALVES